MKEAYASFFVFPIKKNREDYPSTL